MGWIGTHGTNWDSCFVTAKYLEIFNWFRLEQTKNNKKVKQIFKPNKTQQVPSATPSRSIAMRQERNWKFVGFEPTQNPRILVNWPLVAVHTWSRQKLPRNVRHTSIVARCRDSRELQPCFTGGKVNKIIVDNKRVFFFANGVEVQRRFREVVVMQVCLPIPSRSSA